MFFHHLLPCPSNSCSFGVHFEGLSDFEDPSKFIKVLEEICFHNLVDGYVFPDVPDRFVIFLNWVRGEVRPFHVDFKQDVTSSQGRDLLYRNDLLWPIDVKDREFSWVDQNAISFRIQDGSGSAPMFTAYTDLNMIQSMVCTPTVSSDPFNWTERVMLIRISSSQQGKHQSRSLNLCWISSHLAIVSIPQSS